MSLTNLLVILGLLTGPVLGLKPCYELMLDHGMNMSHFSNAAAHGIHSLYLEDIRFEREREREREGERQRGEETA